MTRVFLTVINPGAETGLGAEWVNVSNVITRRNDLSGYPTGFTGGYQFDTQNTGAFNHYQAVAIPAGEYAAVDAGVRSFNLEAYAGKWQGVLPPSTMEMYVEAYNGSSVLLQTWTRNVFDTTKTYVSIFRTLPANTRTLRIGWRGTSQAAGDIWVDDVTLALDDLAPLYDRVGVITIDKTQCGAADTSNFIFNVKGTYGEFRSILNGGYVRGILAGDLRFFSDSARTIELDREIEYWNNLTGEISVWITVPTLTVAVNTQVFWACGRNNGEGHGNTGVLWTNHVRVQHFGKVGATYTIKAGADSSPYGKGLGYWNTTVPDATADAAQSVTGQIGDGLSVVDFGPAYTTTRSWGHQAEFDNLKSGFTISAWVKPTAYPNHLTIVAKGNPTRAFTLFVSPTGKGIVSATQGGVLKDVTGTTTFPTTDFTHIKGVYDGSFLRLYINGVQEGTLAVTGNLDTNTATAFIGQLTTAVLVFNGTIDEVRLSTSPDSADRTLAEYNNQKPGSTFYTFGASVSGSQVQRSTIMII